MFIPVQDVVLRFWFRVIDFLPDFFAGLIILLCGITLGSIFKRVFKTLLRFMRVDRVFQKTRLIHTSEVLLWIDVLAEILKWTIIILFLIPTLEAWRLSQATTVLNQILFYIPNVIVSVVIGFFGIIASNLASGVVEQSVKPFHRKTARGFGLFAKITLIFFTVLLVLNQLGVAQDLIRILFTGIVAMIALAGGLAFGLGGKEGASELLKEIKTQLQKNK